MPIQRPSFENFTAVVALLQHGNRTQQEVANKMFDVSLSVISRSWNPFQET